ncbi:hypothetical protein IWW50_000041 [Coemansia erecta]|nr:hypothetical protein IWW50_000041 [Coemansia erecta]
MLKLDLGKSALLELQPQAWIPNPQTSKLASAFALPCESAAPATIYCSQCAKFFDSPTIYFGHISTCD